MPRRSVPTPILPWLLCHLNGKGWVSDHAARLLELLGVCVVRLEGREEKHPALSWATSGAMALTGKIDEPPRMCPVPLAACVDGVRAALIALSGISDTGRFLPDSATLGERAALSGLRRNGLISPGRSCQLLQTKDGWLAVNLPRPDDWQLLPAWLEQDGASTWNDLATSLACHSASTRELVERGRLMGLAVAAAKDGDINTESLAAPWQITALATPSHGIRRSTAPLIVDLSSLWAGPLSSHLLQMIGASVIKVESLQRPDGARQGVRSFYDLLNHGKASIVLDFSTPQGVEKLKRLIEHADIVIEASRPRALRHLGIVAEEMVAAVPGLTWVSITGYGRNDPNSGWIAYGDDAAVAAGLSDLICDANGRPLFCGDAIADPITGWHAALAALASFKQGGGNLISLALHDVVDYCRRIDQPSTKEAVHQRQIAWTRLVEGRIKLPHARKVTAPARPFGADTSSLPELLRGWSKSGLEGSSC